MTSAGDALQASAESREHAHAAASLAPTRGSSSGIERCRRARLTRITRTALTRMMPSSSGVSRAGDRLLRQPAEAGNGKDAFDDDAAAEHGRRLQAEHGDQRQQARCARRGASTMRRRGQPRGAGGKHEILPPDLGHAGAHDAQVQRQIDEAEGWPPAGRDGGRCRAARSRPCLPEAMVSMPPIGQPAQPDGEHDGQHQAEPEAGTA